MCGFGRLKKLFDIAEKIDEDVYRIWLNGWYYIFVEEDGIYIESRCCLGKREFGTSVVSNWKKVVERIYDLERICSMFEKYGLWSKSSKSFSGLSGEVNVSISGLRRKSVEPCLKLLYERRD